MIYTTPQALRASKTITTTTSLTLLYWTDIITSYYYFPPPPPKKLSCLNEDYVCRKACMYVRTYVCTYVYVVVQFHPWFKFCPFVLKLIIIHYLTSKQRGIKLNHSIYTLNRDPRKCNYYFYLGLEMCFWDSSCQ